MAEAAKRLDRMPLPPAPAPQRTWSGEVHGPVAAMHHAIESGLAAQRAASVIGVDGPGPIERALRTASRLAGWTVLTFAVVATARLIF